MMGISDSASSTLHDNLGFRSEFNFEVIASGNFGQN